MADERPNLVDLASAVADGTPVDWPGVESSDGDDERELVRGLRLLERVAEVHGGLAHDSTGSDAPPPTRQTGDLTAGPEPVHWGPLRLIERIGHGAFGDVYRAWDARLDREVALKLLAPREAVASAAETLSASAIVDEGRLLARVRHSGVVTAFGADRIDGRVGVWMELVAGRTMEAELLERGPLPADEIVRIGIELADALAAVHRAGLIHRDIKAQNVMRESSGRLVLMDFGTGLEFAETADTVALAGTPLYLAPEVIERGGATPQSDVYGLGVLLYHLATGRFPVEGRTLREIRAAHARGERKLLASRRPGLPRRLVSVIERALAPATTDRYADAAALSHALAGIGRSARRKRVWGLATAAAIGLTLAVAGLARLLSGPGEGVAGGVTWMEVPDSFSLRANLRGPSVDGAWVPCTSPRGSRNVAFCSVIDGSVRLLRESPRPASIGQPAGRSLLSPDGRLLAYAWTGEPDRDTTTINVIRLDATGNREIYRGTNSAVVEHWTADGRAVVVRDGSDSEAHRVLLVAADGGAPLELWRLTAADVRASLSPDARTLLIERRVAPGNSDLVAVDLESGQEAWQYSSPVDDVSPVWMPDGTGVVFVTNPQGCYQIARLTVAGGRLTDLPDPLHDLGPQTAHLAGFGAGGTLFVSYQNRWSTAFVADVDLDGAVLGAGRSLPASCTDVTVGADWSPDGQRMAFVRSLGMPDGDTEVVVVSADGRVERTYDVPGVFDRKNRVRWSPDGTTLAVATREPAIGGVLSLIDVSSGTVREIARTSGSAGRICHPRWNGDGTLCYRDGAIWQVDRTGGLREPVFRAGPGESVLADAAFDIASDGTLVVGIARPNEACTVRLRSTDGRERDRHTFDAPCLGMTWSRDGSKLLVGTSLALWSLDRENGEPNLLQANRRGFWDLSLSPDGRRLLFTLGTAQNSWATLKIPGLSTPRAARLSLPARWQPLKTQPVETTLTGRVTDEDGNPVPRVYVYAWRRIVRDGVTSWSNDRPGAQETDADGRYVLGERPPGEYVITAAATIRLQERMEQRMPPPVVGPDGVRRGYVTTSYRAPGSTVGNSTLVSAGPGEVAGLDIRLERQALFTLRGRVIASPGVVLPPIAGSVRRTGHDINVAPPGGGRQIELRNNRFEVADIPEGTYDVVIEFDDYRAEARVEIAGRTPPPVILTLRPK